jgi:hypothetical protein
MSGFPGYTTLKGSANTYLAVKLVLADDIPGDFAELGVAAGSKLAIMQRALRDSGAVRVIHAFDSFQGIQMAGPRDRIQPGIGDADPAVQKRPPAERLVSSGITAHGLAEVQHYIASRGLPLDNMVFHQGWVQQTLPAFTPPPSGFALLRLDMDMYEPTLCALEHLYPHLSPGGVLILDDYGGPVVDGDFWQVNAALADYFGKIGKAVPELDFPTEYGLAWFRKPAD